MKAKTIKVDQSTQSELVAYLADEDNASELNVIQIRDCVDAIFGYDRATVILASDIGGFSEGPIIIDWQTGRAYWHDWGKIESFVGVLAAHGQIEVQDIGSADEVFALYEAAALDIGSHTQRKEEKIMNNEAKFTEEFDAYACEGDFIETEHNGYNVRARIVRDFDSHIDDDDVHNPDCSVTGIEEDSERHNRLLRARKAWLDDEWFYCGIVLSVSYNGIELDDHAASLWVIECNYTESEEGRNPNCYLLEAANELLPEALEQAEKARASMLKKLASESE